jgi:hypothetical protein
VMCLDALVSTTNINSNKLAAFPPCICGNLLRNLVSALRFEAATKAKSHTVGCRIVISMILDPSVLPLVLD